MLRARLDANDIENVDDNEKQSKHASNHNEPPWPLMRALVFLSDGSLFRMGEQAQSR